MITTDFLFDGLLILGGSFYLGEEQSGRQPEWGWPRAAQPAFRLEARGRSTQTDEAQAVKTPDFRTRSRR
jgi:hypothetical protein